MFCIVHFKCKLEVKGHKYQGQRSNGSGSNKDIKQRQMGSQQRQVASFPPGTSYTNQPYFNFFLLGQWKSLYGPILYDPCVIHFIKYQLHVV